MKKDMKRKLWTLVMEVALVFGGITILLIGVFNYKKQTIKNVHQIEVEIIDVHFLETNTKAVVDISMENGNHELYLQQDTVIKNERGKKLTCADLKVGQFIRAEVDPTVLYDARMVETETGTSYESIDIYWRCYEVVILE